MRSAIALHDRKVQNERNRAEVARIVALFAAKKPGQVIELAAYRALPPPPDHPESGRVRRR